MTNPTTRTYTVLGMSCSHCVNAVREKVSKIAAVARVDVNLDSGELTVAGDDVCDDDIRHAVHSAGYELAAR